MAESLEALATLNPSKSAVFSETSSIPEIFGRSFFIHFALHAVCEDSELEAPDEQVRGLATGMWDGLALATREFWEGRAAVARLVRDREEFLLTDGSTQLSRDHCSRAIDALSSYKRALMGEGDGDALEITDSVIEEEGKDDAVVGEESSELPQSSSSETSPEEENDSEPEAQLATTVDESSKTSYETELAVQDPRKHESDGLSSPSTPEISATGSATPASSEMEESSDSSSRSMSTAGLSEESVAGDDAPPENTETNKTQPVEGPEPIASQQSTALQASERRPSILHANTAAFQPLPSAELPKPLEVQFNPPAADFELKPITAKPALDGEEEFLIYESSDSNDGTSSPTRFVHIHLSKPKLNPWGADFTPSYGDMNQHMDTHDDTPDFDLAVSSTNAKVKVNVTPPQTPEAVQIPSDLASSPIDSHYADDCPKNSEADGAVEHENATNALFDDDAPDTVPAEQVSASEDHVNEEKEPVSASTPDEVSTPSSTKLETSDSVSNPALTIVEADMTASVELEALLPIKPQDGETSSPSATMDHGSTPEASKIAKASEAPYPITELNDTTPSTLALPEWASAPLGLNWAEEMEEADGQADGQAAAQFEQGTQAPYAETSAGPGENSAKDEPSLAPPTSPPPEGHAVVVKTESSKKSKAKPVPSSSKHNDPSGTKVNNAGTGRGKGKKPSTDDVSKAPKQTLPVVTPAKPVTNAVNPQPAKGPSPSPSAWNVPKARKALLNFPPAAKMSAPPPSACNVPKAPGAMINITTTAKTPHPPVSVWKIPTATNTSTSPVTVLNVPKAPKASESPPSLTSSASTTSSNNKPPPPGEDDGKNMFLDHALPIICEDMDIYQPDEYALQVGLMLWQDLSRPTKRSWGDDARGLKGNPRLDNAYLYKTDRFKEKEQGYRVEIIKALAERNDGELKYLQEEYDRIVLIEKRMKRKGQKVTTVREAAGSLSKQSSRPGSSLQKTIPPSSTSMPDSPTSGESNEGLKGSWQFVSVVNKKGNRKYKTSASKPEVW